MIKTKKQGTGRAYGFFYCSASKREIEEQLPLARKVTPNELELTLIDSINPNDFNSDPELKELSESALKEFGNNYAITATLPNATNRQTASELGDFINALYFNTPLTEKFYKDGLKKVRGGIVYKEGDRYEFQE